MSPIPQPFGDEQAPEQTDDLGFRPAAKQARPRLQAQPDDDLGFKALAADDGLGFQPTPKTPKSTFESLYQQGPAGPTLGERAAAATRPRLPLAPPERPLPPPPPPNELAQVRAKPGEIYTANGVQYRFDGLNWSPIGRAQPEPRPDTLARTGGFEDRAVPAMTSPDTLLGRYLESQRIDQPRPFAPPAKVGQGFTEQLPRSLTEAFARFGPERMPIEQARGLGETAKLPLVDLPTLTGAEEPFARGVLRGLGGFTSPENIEFLAATGGLGLAPGALQRLVSLGFTAQLAEGLYQNSKVFRQAVNREDWNAAREIAGESVPQAGMTLLAGRHAAELGRPLLSRLGRPTEAPALLGVQPETPSPLGAEATAPRTIPARPTPFAGEEPLIAPEPTRAPSGAIHRPGPLLGQQRALPLAEPLKLGVVEGADLGFKPLREQETAAPGQIQAPREEARAAAASQETEQAARERQFREQQERGSVLASVALQARKLREAKQLDQLTPKGEPEPILGRTAEPPSGVEATPYQRQQAQLYTNRLRDPIEREYAQSYLQARLAGEPAPSRISTLPDSRARTLAAGVEDYLRKQAPPSVAQRFPPDVIAEAEAEMKAAEALGSSLDRPGRYSGADQFETNASIADASWYGVSATKPTIAGQFPWFADSEISLSRVQRAVRMGKGAEYERIVGKIGEHIQAERESARPVVEEYAPQLRALAEQVREANPELAQTMTDIAEGRVSGFHNLRNYIEERITDAKSATEFAKAIEDAATEARREAGIAEAPEPAGGARQAESVLPGFGQALEEQRTAAAAKPEGLYGGTLSRFGDMPRELAQDVGLLAEEEEWRHTVQRRGTEVLLPSGEVGRIVEPAKDPINGIGKDGMALVEHQLEGRTVQRFYPATQLEMPPTQEGVLPGMERAVEEQQRAAGAEQGRQLTGEINRPAESIEALAGEMETRSPLFRGTEASPQKEIFGEQPHKLQREAVAYLQDVDRIKAKLRRATGAEGLSEGNWLGVTDTKLRDAFKAEGRKGELFGDFLQRISGTELRPKSVPFWSDYPALGEKGAAPRPETKPLTAAQTAAKQRRAETAMQASVDRAIGPQEVGGLYHNGYWGDRYTVLGIDRQPGGRFAITQRWETGSRAGETVTHGTAWDYKRDKVISEPRGEAEKGAVSPQLLKDVITGRLAKEAWGKYVAEPLIERVLKIGDKYRAARQADPDIAEGLHLLDNAPQYLRAKAAQQVHQVIGDLSREQERLLTLMADRDSRENLRINHPEEYGQALRDPAIQQALRAYRPLEQELTAAREKLGGSVLDQDYLRRVYEKHISGIGKESAPGSERATTGFDRVIRPQRTDKFGREATAEYHYETGLHEFGPAYATKAVATNLKVLRDTVAQTFISKATQLPIGTPEPRFIEYGDEVYYRPDVAADMRRAGQHNVKAYDRYDPTAGERFPQPGEGKYLGPSELVRALNDYGRREASGPSSLQRFFQEQVIGFGFGIPHVFNILRRVSQSAPLGALNPQGWARAWKVAFDKELRARGISGLDDPTFDALAQHGAISTGEFRNLKQYIGGNLNPANWLRTLAQVGHRVIFEPGRFGIGGFDQRARLYIGDLVKSQNPSLTDSEVAWAVNTQLGDYNRANWTDRQKMLGKVMIFPGWDFSSMRWVLQHPIKTTVPPAVLVLLANQVLHRLGQNRPEDQYDIFNVHFGDRSFGVGLVREPLARNLYRPILSYAQAKARGLSDQRALAESARGITAGAGGMLGMLRPDLSGFVALATNRESLFGGKELVSKDDYTMPGKVLPTRALEKQAAFTVRHALPALDRMLDRDQEIDLRSFAGGNLGLPNYRDDAEKRLIRNAAEADRVYTTVSRMAKTNPTQAREFMKDRDNATYALFHRDFQQLVGTLHRMDQAREMVVGSGLTDAEKQSKLRTLDASRRSLLEHADGLGNVLFQRRQQARQQIRQGRLGATPPGLLGQQPPRLGLRMQ